MRAVNVAMVDKNRFHQFHAGCRRIVKIHNYSRSIDDCPTLRGLSQSTMQFAAEIPFPRRLDRCAPKPLFSNRLPRRFDFSGDAICFLMHILLVVHRLQRSRQPEVCIRLD